MTESFLASVEDLYNALTEREVGVVNYVLEDETSFLPCAVQLIEAFTQSKAVVEAHRGGMYSIMDGQITGEFLECTRPSRIVQKWRLKTWPDGRTAIPHP